MKNIVIFYHQGCQDGFSAAWAAWKKFGLRASYFPILHDDSIPKKLKNKRVYFLDITYLGQKLKKIIRDNKEVTIIDHHISAKREIKSAPNYSFALNKSGAGLAWEFFHKNKKAPRLIKYVEEGDLWKFKSPHVREILSAIEAKPFNFKTWSKIARELEDPESRKKYIAAGKAIREYENKMVKKLFDNTELAQFEGYQAGVVNSPLLESELGKEIYSRGFKIAIIWHRRAGVIKVSLRSEKADVSKLAQKYGGGGHRKAAGFRFDAKLKLPWRYIKR